LRNDPLTGYNSSIDGNQSAICKLGGVESITTGNAKMAEGTIKKLTNKHFGFIKTDTDKDLFFHESAVQGVSFEALQVGQKVSYTEGQSPKGPRAENVKPV